jgi:four helix bundle protein
MIKSFTDLQVWQSSRRLALIIYKETKMFPESEKFGLVSQIRRAVISVSSNIAEGYGRSSSKDREHFYVMASGSLFELKSQIIISNDLGFLDTDIMDRILAEADITHKQINSLLRVHRSRSD